MTLLIKLVTPNELISYEGCALAMTLATFGENVQLYLDANVFGLLLQPNTRLSGMIKSLDLYDLPPAWVEPDVFTGWLMGMVPSEIASQLTQIPESLDNQSFKSVLHF